MQNTVNERKNLLTIGEASEYLGVSIDTLRRWERRGRIEPYRSPGGHRHYVKDELDKLFDKKYVRDEPTIRKKTVEKETIKEEVKAVEEPEVIPHLVGIPSWRAVDLPREYSEEGKESVEPQKATTPEPVILDRPTREVSIPQSNPLRIIQERKEEILLTPQEAYYRQQSISVLTPPASDKPVSSATQSPAKTNSNSLSEFVKENKKIIIYSSLFAGVIILSITWYLAWLTSQRVLSPIP